MEHEKRKERAMNLRKLHLSLALASILTVGIAGAGATEPPRARVPSTTSPAPIVFMGKSWCFDDAPATLRCDVRVAKARPNLFTRLRLRVTSEARAGAPERASSADTSGVFTRMVRDVRARLQNAEASQATK
jgi:hypothetical protein